MSKPFVLGLTGSIGMGKSTTAQMFADAGVAVWDADAAVHRMYGTGGAAVEPMRSLRPQAIVDGVVSRDALKAWIAKDDSALAQIEAIVHPLLAQDREEFLAAGDADILLLDIPLLFEMGLAERVDAVAVVTAPADLQRARVLERGTMDAAQFELILSKQLPDADKRARADYIIETVTLEDARASVTAILSDIREKMPHA